MERSDLCVFSMGAVRGAEICSALLQSMVEVDKTQTFAFFRVVICNAELESENRNYT